MTEKVEIKVSPFTAKFIQLWYNVVKKGLCFDSIDEFLMSAVRNYTIPYSGKISPEKMKKFAALYEA